MHGNEWFVKAYQRKKWTMIAKEFRTAVANKPQKRTGNCCTQTLIRLWYRLLRDYFYTKCSTWTSQKCRERYTNAMRISVLVGLHNYLRLGATLRPHRECNIAYTTTSCAHTGDLSRGFREPIAKFFVQHTVYTFSNTLLLMVLQQYICSLEALEHH